MVALARIHRLSFYLKEWFTRFKPAKIDSEGKPVEKVNLGKGWKYISQFLVILYPFYEATRRVQFKETPMSNYRYIIVNDLKNACTSFLKAESSWSLSFDKFHLNDVKLNLRSKLIKSLVTRLHDEVDEVFNDSIHP